MSGPYRLLAAMPEIRLHWTDNQDVLVGRRARWFPIQQVIAIDRRLRRLLARCSLAHELGHVVHGDTCGTEGDLYDLRRELRADEFAARLLLPSLDEIARTVVVTSGDGHAARELNVTLDLYRTRLDTFTPDERHEVERQVVTAAGEWGA
ncbi:ImmA/IrrE family metallo-endopeptidase [Nocardioides montaniterrae]